MPEFILALISEHDKLKKSTLYHFLVGKRTSSTLVFGFLNQLLPYFGLFKKMSKETYERAVGQLVESGQLTEVAGVLQVNPGATSTFKINYPTLKGYPLSLNDDKSWELFLFSVQVVANLHATQKNYLPLVTDWVTQRQVKFWLAECLGEASGRAAYVAELKKILRGLSDEVADNLSRQFSAEKLVGTIYEQIYAGTPLEKFLHYKADIHAFLAAVQVQKAPILQRLLFSTVDSMGETAQLIDEGFDLAQIKQRRQFLKMSTVRDHVLERAILNPATFPFARFFDALTLADLQKKVATAPDICSWQYQDLIAPANDFLTYRLFQIQQLGGSEANK